LETPKLGFQVRVAEIVLHARISISLVSVLVDVLVQEVVVSIFSVCFRSITFDVEKPSTQAVATTIGPGFAVLGKKQSRFLFVVVFGFVGDPPAFEGRNIDRRSISWGLETWAAKGHTIDEVFAVD